MKPLRVFTPALVLGCLACAVVACGAVVGIAALLPPAKVHVARPARVAAAAAVYLSGRIPLASPVTAAGPCRLARRPTRALNTIALFVATAVARRNTGLSYELATPAMRQGLSCARWESGTIPVVPMQAIDWARGIPYHLVSRSQTSLSLLVRIRSRLPGFGTHFFTIRTVARRGRWFVSYFMAADPIVALAASGR